MVFRSRSSPLPIRFSVFLRQRFLSLVVPKSWKRLLAQGEIPRRNLPHKVAITGDQGERRVETPSGGGPLLGCLLIMTTFMPRVITPRTEFFWQWY